MLVSVESFSSWFDSIERDILVLEECREDACRVGTASYTCDYCIRKGARVALHLLSGFHAHD